MADPTPDADQRAEAGGQPAGDRGAWRDAGARVQGLLLAVPVFLALLRLMALAEGVSLFRYQGF